MSTKKHTKKPSVNHVKKLNELIRKDPKAYTRSFVPGLNYRIKDKWAIGKWVAEVVNNQTDDSVEYKLKEGLLPYVLNDSTENPFLILPVNRKKPIVLIFEKVGKITGSYKYIGLKFIGKQIHKLQVNVTHC